MRTGKIWIAPAVLAFAGLVLVIAKSWRVLPERISPENYRRVLDEISSVDFSLSYLTPDHAGKTLAYIRAAEEMRGLVLLDLQTLRQQPVMVTNEVIQINCWSSDDRYLTFVQSPPQPEKKNKPGVVKESWLTLYDRNDQSVRRLTENTNVVESFFFWLTTNTYLLVSRSVETDRAEIFMRNLDGGTEMKISNYTPELVMMSSDIAAYAMKGNIHELEIKPLKKSARWGWDDSTRTVRQLSAFQSNGFDLIKWLRYRPENGTFLFCARPTNSNWRYLFRFNPQTQMLKQLSDEDTYNGQFLEQGEGYAYVMNTNNAFHLAVRTKLPESHTNLFIRGSVLNYTASPSGDLLYAAAAIGVEPHGIWEYSLQNRTLRQVVNGMTTPFSVSRIVEPQEWRMKCFDGLATPCFLFPPVQLAAKAPTSDVRLRDRILPGVKYPLVIYVPPMSYQFQRAFDPQAQVFANMGFYYAAINYRGCDGYGVEYAKSVNLQDAVRDVLQLYEELVKNPSIDAKNVFLCTSSGGMAIVSELLATQPTLWRAVGLDKPAACPIDNRFEPGKLPPMLMVMGEQDPALDSMKYFVTWAKTNKVEVKPVIHANTGHNTYNLADRKDTLRQISEFFVSHLK